jgi:hypothetical protein
MLVSILTFLNTQFLIIRTYAGSLATNSGLGIPYSRVRFPLPASINLCTYYI